MHFYFRPPLLLYAYSLVQAHHSSCLKGHKRFPQSCYHANSETWEFDRDMKLDWHPDQILMSPNLLPEVPQTFARSSCGRLFKLGAPSLVLEPLIQGIRFTARRLENYIAYSVWSCARSQEIFCWLWCLSWFSWWARELTIFQKILTSSLWQSRKRH